ncbi:unnamed protein product [Periconia digitata]|uniref:Uncharacterized protein n=1 Tax=Periconia digitata TaxID=1303443 RepID=A0A9W4UQM7_9PLEO|nr:unnamed protein product [Periconia digitata]
MTLRMGNMRFTIDGLCCTSPGEKLISASLTGDAGDKSCGLNPPIVWQEELLKFRCTGLTMGSEMVRHLNSLRCKLQNNAGARLIDYRMIFDLLAEIEINNLKDPK